MVPSNEFMARFEENGASELFITIQKTCKDCNHIRRHHRNWQAFTCDEIRTSDDDKIQLGNSQDFRIYHDGSTNIIDGHYHPIELRHQSEVHTKTLLMMVNCRTLSQQLQEI